jgi:hypothetical protein
MGESGSAARRRPDSSNIGARRAIVQQAGGSISVCSQVGDGTTFRIALPATAEALPARAGGEVAPRGGRETVLLAEDEHAVPAATRRILARPGTRCSRRPAASKRSRCSS